MAQQTAKETAQQTAQQRTVDDLGRPIPKPSRLTQPFWDALRRRELMLQRCTACDTFVHTPKLRCPNCRSANLGWEAVDGAGHVYSYTVVHRPVSKPFAPLVPYVVALVELDECGVRLLSNIVGTDPTQIRIGMGVQVAFDDVTSDFTVFRFQPTEQAAA